MGKKALVTGASGLLGRDIVKAFAQAGWDVVGTALTRTSPPAIVKLDLESEEDIIGTLDSIKPDVVVHSAANRFPDNCTQNPESAQRVNATATGVLARETNHRGIFLLYISTDYVFSGAPGKAPYTVSATPGPTNAYGRTKLDGEMAVLQATRQSDGRSEAIIKRHELDDGVRPTLGAVLRIPLLYGHLKDADDKSKSAVHALVDAVRRSQETEQQEKVRVDDYALRYPTCTEDVARVCVDICTKYLAATGVEPVHAGTQLPHTLHFSSEQRLTKFEMCTILAEMLALPTTGLERWDPREDDAKGLAEGLPVTVRPYDTHLDLQVLKDLAIDVGCCDFRDWWRRELSATERP